MTLIVAVPGHSLDFDDGLEPSVEELEAIEAEGPVLAAELAAVVAECDLLAYPSLITARRLRRAQDAVVRAYLALYQTQPKEVTL